MGKASSSRRDEAEVHIVPAPASQIIGVFFFTVGHVGNSYRIPFIVRSYVMKECTMCSAIFPSALPKIFSFTTACLFLLKVGDVKDNDKERSTDCKFRRFKAAITSRPEIARADVRGRRERRRIYRGYHTLGQQYVSPPILPTLTDWISRPTSRIVCLNVDATGVVTACEVCMD